MSDDKCTRDHLQALVPVYDRYSVNDDGTTDDFVSAGESDHDRLDIEEYCCDNCGEFFTPDKRYDYAALTEAWQAALEHTA